MKCRSYGLAGSSSGEGRHFGRQELAAKNHKDRVTNQPVYQRETLAKVPSVDISKLGAFLLANLESFKILNNCHNSSLDFLFG